MHDISSINSVIDRYVDRTGQQRVTAPKAGELLDKAGVLKDSKSKPGLPLRKLLRRGLLQHAYQMNGKWTRWTIPH